MTVSRCFRCGLKTTIPFEERPPCECGSTGWYIGRRAEWPPMEAPAYLVGQIPGGDVLSVTSYPVQRMIPHRRSMGKSRAIPISELPLLTGPGSAQKN